MKVVDDNVVQPMRGIRARFCEDPHATRRRLGVSTEKLFAYYDMLSQQLADSSPSILALLAGGDMAAARLRIDGLRTGCITLGLWHAATMIEGAGALEAGLIGRVLKEVEAIVEEQMLAAKAELGSSVQAAPKAGAAAGPGSRTAAAPA